MYDISRFISFLQIVRLRLTFFNIDFLENEGVLSKEEVTVSVCIERLHAARISLLVIAEQITAGNRGKRKIINEISEPKLKSETSSGFNASILFEIRSHNCPMPSPESVQKVTISYFHLSSPKPKPVPVQSSTPPRTQQYSQHHGFRIFFLRRVFTTMSNRDKRNISLLECWLYDVTFHNVNSCLKGCVKGP